MPYQIRCKERASFTIERMIYFFLHRKRKIARKRMDKENNNYTSITAVIGMTHKRQAKKCAGSNTNDFPPKNHFKISQTMTPTAGKNLYEPNAQRARGRVQIDGKNFACWQDGSLFEYLCDENLRCRTNWLVFIRCFIVIWLFGAELFSASFKRNYSQNSAPAQPTHITTFETIFSFRKWYSIFFAALSSFRDSASSGLYEIAWVEKLLIIRDAEMMCVCARAKYCQLKNNLNLYTLRTHTTHSIFVRFSSLSMCQLKKTVWCRIDRRHWIRVVWAKLYFCW